MAGGEGYGLANVQPRNRSSLDGRRLSPLALEKPLKSLMHGVAILKGVRRTPTTQAFLDLCGDLLRGKPLPGTIVAANPKG